MIKVIKIRSQKYREKIEKKEFGIRTDISLAIPMETSILSNWKTKVDEKYEEGFVNKFVSNALKHALTLKRKHSEEYNHFMEYIKYRERLFKTSKQVLQTYIQSITDNLTNQSVKHHFKLYVNLGKEKREKIEKEIRKQITKIECAEEKQLIATKQSMKDMENTLTLKDKEIALLKRKLEQSRIQYDKLNDAHNDLKTCWFELSMKYITQQEEFKRLSK